MLSFEDIKFYRSLARAEMKEEKLIPFALRQQQQQQSQGFFLVGGTEITLKPGDDSLIRMKMWKSFMKQLISMRMQSWWWS